MILCGARNACTVRTVPHLPAMYTRCGRAFMGEARRTRGNLDRCPRVRRRGGRPVPLARRVLLSPVRGWAPGCCRCSRTHTRCPIDWQRAADFMLGRRDETPAAREAPGGQPSDTFREPRACAEADQPLETVSVVCDPVSGLDGTSMLRLPSSNGEERVWQGRAITSF